MKIKKVLWFFFFVIIPFVSYLYLVFINFSPIKVQILSDEPCRFEKEFLEYTPEMFIVHNFQPEDTLIWQVVNSNILMAYEKFDSDERIIFISNSSEALSEEQIGYFESENRNLGKRWLLQSSPIFCDNLLSLSSKEILLLDEKKMIIAVFDGTSFRDTYKLRTLMKSILAD